MKKNRFSRGVLLLPSLCTTGSMFCAFFSIIRSINGDYVTAAWAIFVAGLFDMLDGRVARMTKTQSEFGAQYDSLVDLASFGLAPALLVYTWALSRFPPVGWFLAFIFFACAALRLARFNVQTSVVDKKKFHGLPTPPAACLIASLVLFYQGLYGPVPVKSLVALVLVPLLSFLMVSGVPYRSFKEYDVKKKNSFYVLLGASAVIGVIAIKPEIVLFAGFLTYVLSGPVGMVLLRRAVKLPAKAKTSRKLAVVEGLPRSGQEAAKRSSHE